MRIPGAATLILLGLLILWLASTGKLDRLWTGLNYARGVTNTLDPQGNIAAPTTATVTPQVLDSATYHFGNMLDTLIPGVALSHPGGLS